MANFNTLSEAQIKTELLTYGFEWIASPVLTPLTMYFKDYLGTILKLEIDTTTLMSYYTANESSYFVNQEVIISPTAAADLIALDTLMEPVFANVDPVIIKTERITSLTGLDILTPTVSTYFSSTVFQDSLAATYYISEIQSPYRYKEVYWVPVTLIESNWVLADNAAVIVNTADKVTNAYGDFIVVKI
jgi:hypothetical protein